MGDLGDPLRFDTSSQPLTRADCGNAGMLWDEGANVCTDSTSTVEANLSLFQAKAPEVRGDALAALGESKSKSTKGGESPAAVHKPEITTVESPAEVETAAPRRSRRPPSRRPPAGRKSLRRRPPPSRSMSRAAARVVGLWRPGRPRRAR